MTYCDLACRRESKLSHNQLEKQIPAEQGHKDEATNEAALGC
jgi:hypothetical protein